VKLLSAIKRTTGRALASGALQGIEPETRLLGDGGVRFILRTVSSLARKEKARTGPTVADPLGEFDPDLFVADLGPAHYLLLNKFNLLSGHVLVVTRHFEHQECLLTVADFEALDAVLREVDGLGFYNGGAEAGASQARKHLQLVPLPLAPESADEVPMEWALVDGEALPFAHAFERIAPQASAADRHALYRELLRRVGITGIGSPEDESQSAAYNLLVRRGWMLVVPRSHACFETIPLNALAYAGSLFVRSLADLERARAVGPMEILRSCAGLGVRSYPT